MKKGKRQHSAPFKAKVVLDTLRGDETTAVLAAKYEVHPTQINKWKKATLDALPGFFGQSAERKKQDDDALQDRLYRQIGQLQVENDWLKKKLGL
jgi:transposase-like protein